MSAMHHQVVDVNIAEDAALTDVFAIDGFAAGSFQTPAAMTSDAVVKLEVSNDGVTFDDLRDTAGDAVTYTPAYATAAVNLIPLPAALFNFRFARMTVDASEAAARVLKFFFRTS